MELTTPAKLAFGRLGFGSRPSEHAAFVELGDTDEARLRAHIAVQLDPGSIDDSETNRRIAQAGFSSVDLDRSDLWRQFVRDVDDETDPSTPLDELRLLTMLRATHSKRQLHEVLVDFWHNHFNVFGDSTVVRSMIMRYDRDVIRANALGNFRTMLGQVAESACMLYYLDNYVSTVAGPNENWARELLELHTLGAENYLGSDLGQADVEGFPEPVGYVDEDVYEATRAFTGWSVAHGRDEDPDDGTFLYRADAHDRFNKRVLGQELGPDQPDLADGRMVLDLLATHPGTARHVSRKLCRRFVADDPPDALVESAAQVFLANVDAVDQLRTVVEHIVLSDEFAVSWGAKVKRPFDAAVSVLRATELDLSFAPDDAPSQAFMRSYAGMGQPLFGWPSPDGYADNSGYWLNTNSVFKQWRLTNALLASSNDDGRYLVDVEGSTPDDAGSAEELVDYWTVRLLGEAASDESRVALVEFMGQGFDPSFDLGRDDETQERIRALVSTILMMPEFQWQ